MPQGQCILSNSLILLPLKLPGIPSWGLWIKLAKNVSSGILVLFTHVRKSAATSWLMTYSTTFLFKVTWTEPLTGWIVWGGFSVIFHLSLFALIWWMSNWSKWFNGWITIKDCDCMGTFCKWKVLYSHYFIVPSRNLFHVISCTYYKNSANLLMVPSPSFEPLKICNIFTSS